MIVVPATLLVIVAVAGTGRAMAATHEATAIGVLLPGDIQITRDTFERRDLAGNQDADHALGSPYLRVGSAEQEAAKALVQSLKGKKLPGDLDLALHDTQPILRVTAHGTGPRQVEQDARRALAAINTLFEARQEARDVPPELFLRLEPVTEPVARSISEERLRAMTAVGAVGALVVVGLALVVERFALVRRRVRAAVVTTGDSGPVAVLIGFALVLVLIPQIHSLGPFAVTGPMVVGTVAGGLWAAGRFLPRGTTERMPAVGVALLVFVAVALASYALAQLRPLRELEASGADRRIAFLIMFSGITLLAAEGLHTASQLRRLLVVFVTIAAAHALVGVLQVVGGVEIPGFTRVNSPRGGFPRVAGTARHPIDFGVYCATAVPLALHYASFGAVRRTRIAAAAAAATLAAGAALSITRSALLGLVIGTAVLLAGRRGPRRWALLGAGLVLVALTPLVVPNFADSVGEMVGGAADSPSVQSRVADYEPVLDHFLRQPFLGRGTGTFEPSVHFVLDNNYLNLLVEMGLAGVVAFVAILAAAFMASRRVRRSADDPAVRDRAQALAAAIAVLAVSMGTYDLMAFQLGTGSLFLLLGCAAANARLVLASAAPRHTPPPQAPLPAEPLPDKPLPPSPAVGPETGSRPVGASTTGG